MAKLAPTSSPEDALNPSGYSSVDPAAAEGMLAEAHLGERIKKLRLKRSMGLV